MYKLLLVDDEEEVRKGILQKIEWEKYGFEIAGEAENGKEALEIAEKVVPDVVITDIKMPFMDGLKLSEILSSRFPTTKVIILTGFDEFEYAQKAIKLNVVEYVLKPVSSKDVIDMLIKVKGKIDEEMAQREDMQALREYYRKSIPVLREKFLTSLITGNMKRQEVLQKAYNYQIDIEGRAFVVSAISIDYSAVAPAGEGSDGQVETEAFHITEDRELMKFAVLNISEEIISKYSMGILFLHNDNVIVISNFQETHRDEVMGRIRTALEEIRQAVQKYLKFTVTMGVGTICEDICHVYKSYANAMSALDYTLLLGSNRVIYIDDVEPDSVEKVVFDDLKAHSLTSCMKVGTVKELEEVVEGLFKELVEAKASFNDYQVYLLEMLTSILKVAKDLNVDMDNLFGANYNLFVEMYRRKDIQEVKSWVIGICSNIMGYISKERQNSCKLLVSKAKEYMEENYRDTDMTIDKVCKYLHISPTYFSTIFKRETKLTFVNYLTHIRMEAAKELLRTSSMKTFEIAEKVGYAEPNYFSYCFKKNYGISPSEYRNVN